MADRMGHFYYLSKAVKVKQKESVVLRPILIRAHPQFDGSEVADLGIESRSHDGRTDVGLDHAEHGANHLEKAMNRTAAALLSAMLVFSSSTWARCKEGEIKQCVANKKKSTMECVSGRWTKCGSDSSRPADSAKAPSTGASAAAK
jgi:predicted GIY-YIG superfamily endonuclease